MANKKKSKAIVVKDRRAGKITPTPSKLKAPTKQQKLSRWLIERRLIS